MKFVALILLRRFSCVVKLSSRCPGVDRKLRFGGRAKAREQILWCISEEFANLCGCQRARGDTGPLLPCVILIEMTR